MNNAELLDLVETLQNLLLAQIRGSNETARRDAADYRELRTSILQHDDIRPLLPHSVRTCRDLMQFWVSIRGDYKHYDEREKVVRKQFAPLFDELESRLFGTKNGLSDTQVITNSTDEPAPQTSTQVSGGVNSSSGRDTSIQGDVVGRDKIVNISVRDESEASAILGTTQNLSRQEYLRLDRQLFQTIREMLPSDKTIKFVREQDYGGPFPWKAHENLRKFHDFSQLPECEFMDTELETARTYLGESISQFLNAIANYAFPVNTNLEFGRLDRDPYEDQTAITHYRGVAKSEAQFRELMDAQQQRVLKQRRETNALADQLCSAYDEFIRLGRRKLAI